MSEGERIRVMVVDDHSIMRFGLKQVLEQSGEFEVVGQGGGRGGGGAGGRRGVA